MEVKQLSPAPYNPRKITDKQLQSLKKAMAEFGDLSGIVVNQRSGNVVGGHQRLKNLDPDWPIHARESTDETGTVALGHIDTPWGQISYRLVDWSHEKEMAANIAANRHGGDWDMAKLNLVMQELSETDFDIDLTGFDISDFQFMDDDQLDDADQQNLGDLKYQVIVDCIGEDEQKRLIEKLEQKGYSCRPLIL